MLVLDLGVFHRHSRETTMREAAGWTVFWCFLALCYNGLVWLWLGSQPALEFITGYLVEWSLSMDNVFVFAVVFGFFNVPMKYQHRVLFWGILGAVVMRFTFILVGSEVIERFDWVLPALGALLVYSGVKLARKGDAEVEPDKNLLLRLARRVMRVSTGEHGNKFFVREAGKLAATPLFLVLLVVESTDVVFAVDSVPAIFGIVNKEASYFEFIVFTSNVFAILGLRALYFLLAGMMNVFRYLPLGLSGILVFVGLKMICEYANHLWHWIELEPGTHLVPPWASLVMVIGILGASIGASIVSANRQKAASSQNEPE
jgi:tellurite resistance protein TerC